MLPDKDPTRGFVPAGKIARNCSRHFEWERGSAAPNSVVERNRSYCRLKKEEGSILAAGEPATAFAKSWQRQRSAIDPPAMFSVKDSGFGASRIVFIGIQTH